MDPCNVWRCACYLRLSREDGTPGESESIAGQRALLANYLSNHPELQTVGEFVDDGWSGVRFDRPGLTALLEAVKRGSVNCILVKDFSRFGRNYIETGRYLERIFPALGVRFLSVTDGYDSLTARQSGDGLLLAFRSLINDAYSRDLSVKARAQRAIRRQQGLYQGPCPLYGYIRSPQCKQRLTPDPGAAPTVQRIFFWKMCGASENAIAQWLESLGVPSPLEYHRLMGHRMDTSFQRHAQARWSPQAVGRILREEPYAGVLTQGREQTPNYKVRRRVRLPSQLWSRTQQAHPPLVSPSLFARVGELLRRDTRVAPGRAGVYLLSSLLYCPCGRWMARRSTGGYRYWVCPQCGARMREPLLPDFLSRVLAVLFHTLGVQKTPMWSSEQDQNWFALQRAVNKTRLAQWDALAASIRADAEEGQLTPEQAAELHTEYQHLHRKTLDALSRLTVPQIPPWMLPDRGAEPLSLPNVGLLSRNALVLLLDRMEPVNGRLKLYFRCHR